MTKLSNLIRYKVLILFIPSILRTYLLRKISELRGDNSKDFTIEGILKNQTKIEVTILRFK